MSTNEGVRGVAAKSVQDLIEYCEKLETRVAELKIRERELIEERNDLRIVLNKIENLGAVRRAADALDEVTKLVQSLK